MKRLVYLLLMLCCMAGEAKGTKNTDSLIHHYMLMLEKNEDSEVFKYAIRIVQLLSETKDKELAETYLQKLRQHMTRKDIPFVNLIEGDIWMQMHQPDSAIKHYQIAADGTNQHMASIAYERMGKWAEENHDLEKAFEMYHKAMNRKTGLASDIFREKEERAYALLQLENLQNKMKVERQRHWIITLALSVFIVVLTGGIIVYYFHRKNQFLKQQEELSTFRMREAMLREKDAVLREELLKRIKVLDKLQGDGHIQLSDTDWKEIRLMLDSTYPDFTQELKRQFPILTEKDINFCCLVKINMSLQSLADIYCISINSVSRRKLRLKEKLGIDKDESLTKFLNRFV